MSAAEKARVLLFVGVVALIYLGAAGSIFNYIRGRKQAAWKAAVFVGLAAIGLLCMAYGYFIEPNWLQVTQITIPSSKIPSGITPIRIAHISDLHSDPRPRLEEELADAIEKQHPDVIVFTGDSINSREGLPVFRAFLSRLSRAAPTFVVKGNWDAWYWNDLALFEGTGAHHLDGKAESLEIEGVSLWLSGLDVASESNLDEVLRSAPPKAFTVFLHHYPDMIEEVADRSVDLYCAGHTHGGQVAVPLYGALVTFSRFGKRYEAGLYREKDTTLYVNRGIGMEGGVPRVRFWSRPELTVIDLVPQ